MPKQKMCYKCQIKKDSDVKCNFILRFIDCMVAQYGCVSAGEGRRRQVSHQRAVTVKILMD